jgi:hypothetical protein
MLRHSFFQRVAWYELHEDVHPVAAQLRAQILYQVDVSQLSHHPDLAL